MKSLLKMFNKVFSFVTTNEKTSHLKDEKSIPKVIKKIKINKKNVNQLKIS